MMKMMMMMKVVVFMTLVGLAPSQADEHSLFYTYTALSKPLHLPGVYQFTALGMLDDRELDYYSSESQVKVPKQDWMKEKMPPDYWEKGTQSRKSKEQWFKVNVDILIDRMNDSKSELHVLQWRHGCTAEETADGNVRFVRGVDEYSYDGSEFLSFDEANSRWIAPVQAALPTKDKWDNVAILNQYTKGYLEKECVDWLTKFMIYGKETLRKHSGPVVHLFTKKSMANSNKLILTCLATSFYPPDVQLQVRKSRTSLPEHLVTSSGVRPNGDGTYQLRKSVEIMKDDELLYDCYVTHSALENPIIKDKNGYTCLDCNTSSNSSFGVVIGVLLAVLVVALLVVIFFLYKTGHIGFPNRGTTAPPATNGHVAYIQAPTTEGHTNGHVNGDKNGHVNGDKNGHVNEDRNGHVNGDTNGHVNVDMNGVANGIN